MKRHAFKASYSGSEYCATCGDQRKVELHYSRFWHAIGEIFEMGWGMLWIVGGIITVIGWACSVH